MPTVSSVCLFTLKVHKVAIYLVIVKNFSQQDLNAGPVASAGTWNFSNLHTCQCLNVKLLKLLY